MERIYSVKEASEKTKIPTRSISYYCKRDRVRKKSNKYQITEEILQKWVKEKGFSPLEFATLQSLCENLRKENKRLELDILELRDQLSDRLSELTELNKNIQENEKLIKEKNKLIEEVKSENEELKNNLKKHSNLTHREQLEKAIELITIEAVKKGLNHRVFTDSEYEEMIGTISQVSFQEEQIQYLRNRVEKQDQILQKISNNLTSSLEAQRERNYIEAKEKGLDT